MQHKAEDGDLSPSIRKDIEDKLSSLHLQVTKLEDEFSLVSSYVPTYTRRSLLGSFTKMKKQVTAVRNKVIPQEKFHFERIPLPTERVGGGTDSESNRLNQDTDTSHRNQTFDNRMNTLPELVPLDMVSEATASILTIEKNQRPQDEIEAPSGVMPDISHSTRSFFFTSSTDAWHAHGLTSNIDPPGINININNNINTQIIPSLAKETCDQFYKDALNTLTASSPPTFSHHVFMKDPAFSMKALDPGNDSSTIFGADFKALITRSSSTKDKNTHTQYDNDSVLSGEDLWLSNLSDCIVVFLCPLVSVRLDNISRCTIILGPVAGPVHIEDVCDSHIVVACRQMRIHHAQKVLFFLHTESDPIVEHCSELLFHPYSLGYQGIVADCAASSLKVKYVWEPSSKETTDMTPDIDTNIPMSLNNRESCTDQVTDQLDLDLDMESQWKYSLLEEKQQPWANVRDFNWIRSVQSPNWDIVPKKNRIRYFRPIFPQYDRKKE